MQRMFWARFPYLPVPQPCRPSSDPNLACFVGGYSNPSSLNATSVRIDHNVRNRLTVFGRFDYAPSEIQQRAVFTTPNDVTVSPALTRTLTLGTTAILRANIVNDVRFNQSRAEFGARTFLDSYGGAVVPPTSAFVPSFASQNAMGNVTIGAQPTTIDSGLNASNVQRQLNMVDTASWTVKSHSIKFGFDYRRLTPIQFGSDYRRLLTYKDVASVLSQTVRSGVIIATNFVLYPVYNNYSAFAQDTWRATPRLTLTYGLRYEVNPSPTEKNGNQPLTVTGLDNLSTLALAPVGTRLYSTTFNNWAPRVGLAYNLLPNRGTVICGGFGVFYDLGYAFTGSAYSTTNYPFANLLFRGNVPLSSPDFTTPPPPVSVRPPYSRLFAYQPGYNLPYTLQYNFTIEQA
jgi:TonB dependent receptor